MEQDNRLRHGVNMSFAINTVTLKAQRLKEIENYTGKYGVGSAGLTETQKQSRIEKIMGGVESEKIKGFGKDKHKGISLYTKAKLLTLIDPNHKGSFDPMPEEIRKELKNYPDDPFAPIKGTHKILNIEIHDDGAMELDGIVLDGTEKDVRTRKTYGVVSLGDVDSTRSEIQQKKEGTLKEVSDRTMAIHSVNGNINELLEAPDIDTNKDKEHQY